MLPYLHVLIERPRSGTVIYDNIVRTISHGNVIPALGMNASTIKYDAKISNYDIMSSNTYPGVTFNKYSTARSSLARYSQIGIIDFKTGTGY